MYEKLWEWLENSWSFQEIWEAGSEKDYVESKAYLNENLEKAVKEGNLDGWFLWLETSMNLEEIWDVGIEQFNEHSDGFRYQMTFYQFKTMLRNKIKEMTIMTMPELAQNLFMGSADDFKST